MTDFLLFHGADPNVQSHVGHTFTSGYSTRNYGVQRWRPRVYEEYAVECWHVYHIMKAKRPLTYMMRLMKLEYALFDVLLSSDTVDVNIANDQGDCPLHVIRLTNHMHRKSYSNLSKRKQTCQNWIGSVKHVFTSQHGRNLDAVRRLMSEGCEIDLPDTAGLTPLHYAVSKNDPDIVQFMLESNCYQASKFCQETDHFETQLCIITLVCSCAQSRWSRYFWSWIQNERTRYEWRLFWAYISVQSTYNWNWMSSSV